jgi:hypothetical protein
MSISHLIGFYFKCEKNEKVDPYEVFPDESFCRIYDENGSSDINDSHIYICNRHSTGCISVDRYCDSGLTSLPTQELPEEFKVAKAILEHHYSNVEICYGVVSYAH